MTAPPTTIVIRIPDPWLVKLPSPLTEREKIHGHITELKSPQQTIAHIATGPCPKIVMATRSMATIETTARARSVGTRNRAKVPISLPIIAPPQ